MTTFVRKSNSYLKQTKVIRNTKLKYTEVYLKHNLLWEQKLFLKFPKIMWNWKENSFIRNITCYKHSYGRDNIHHGNTVKHLPCWSTLQTGLGLLRDKHIQYTKCFTYFLLVCKDYSYLVLILLMITMDSATHPFEYII